MAENNWWEGGQGFPLKNDFNYTGETEWFDEVNEPPMGGITNTGMGNEFAKARRRMTNIPNYTNFNQPLPLPLDANWQHQLSGYGQDMDRGNINNRFNLPQLTGPFMSGIGWLKDRFKRPEEMQTAYESIMGSVDDQGYGTYKGNQYRIEDTPTGKKIYSELYPHGKNLDSLFGSESIEEMENQGYGSLGWAQDRLQKGKAISQRLRNILENRGRLTPTNIQRPTAPTDTGATTPSGPVTTGGGGTFNPVFDPRGRRDSTRSWHGATKARQEAGKQVAGPGFGQGAYWAKGGRVGLKTGGYFDEEAEKQRYTPYDPKHDDFEEEDLNIYDFMQDQGVPYGPMAEGKSPFEIRINELMDEGLSWQEAYKIAAQEFGMAEGEDESFSEEGIASVV